MDVCVAADFIKRGTIESYPCTEFFIYAMVSPWPFHSSRALVNR